MSETILDVVHGGCFCGAVRFTIEMPTLWCAHCHCSMCRRTHGAAFVTWVGVPEASFRYLGDPGTVSEFNSSPDSVRSFCGTCGTTYLFRSARWPGETHVALACLDGPVDRPPQVHAFPDDHVAWITLEGIPVTGRAPDPA